MGNECARAMFLPDVLADQDYTLTVTDNTDTVTATIQIRKGDWWANAHMFWLWFDQRINGAPGGRFSPYIEVVGDVDGGDCAQLVFANHHDFDVSWSPTGRLKYEAGYASGGDVLSHFDETNDSWVTVFPVVEYEKSFEPKDGSSSMGQDGTTASVSGLVQECRSLRVQFDRQSGNYYETAKWLRLWRKYWRRGRSVSFYMETPDSTSIPTTLEWGADGVGKFESLVIPLQDFRWRPSRLVETRNMIDVETDTNKFYLRGSRDGRTHPLYDIPDRFIDYFYSVESTDACLQGAWSDWDMDPEIDPNGHYGLFFFFRLTNSANGLMFTADGGGNYFSIIDNDGSTYDIEWKDNPMGLTLNVGQWYMACLRSNSGESTFWANGTTSVTIGPGFSGDISLGDINGVSLFMDFANIGIVSFLPSDEQLDDLQAAGPRHDARFRTGTWNGYPMILYIRDKLSDNGVLTSYFPQTGYARSLYLPMRASPFSASNGPIYEYDQNTGGW